MSEKQPIVTSQPVPEFGSVQGKTVCAVDGHRDWSSGLCECTNDPTNCVMVALCHPCVLCQLAGRMNEMFCLPCLVPHAPLAMRARLRTLGGIQGTICNDCIVLTCCPHLATCQMKRELDEMHLI